MCQACESPTTAITMDPVVVRSPLVLPGTLVRGAPSSWFTTVGAPRAGDPVPVRLIGFCQATTTRRPSAVRAGIVAADPRYFPTGRLVELYADNRLLGRFLVDSASRRVRRDTLAIWMPTCAEVQQFGRRGGTAVLFGQQSAPASARTPNRR